MTKSKLPPGRRSLTAGHMRFYRAIMEGIDAKRAWEYLPGDDVFSASLCETTVTWVRESLISEAMSTGQPELVGLFMRDPRYVKPSAKPSLTEFAERFGDADDFSEAEITAWYQDEFGRPNDAESRRQRLESRLRNAIGQLENATRRTPAPTDNIGQWLAPFLVVHLRAAGLHTLGAVYASLRSHHDPRWPEVPGVGMVWADRLRAWFSESGIPLAPSSVPVVCGPSFSMVPLERFALPVSQAVAMPPAWGATQNDFTRRAPYPASNNALGANDDKHAIEIWLQARAQNPHTLRSYRKNAERLLLWCYLERQVTFAELKVEDCIHYQTWLQHLGHRTPDEWIQEGWRLPADAWISRKVERRNSESWRPFVYAQGGLSAESIEQDLLTVRSLFEYLRQGQILPMNPWDLLGKRAGARSKIENLTAQFIGRSFTMGQWKMLTKGLSRDGSESDRRLLLVLWLGFSCGLRAAEMLTLTLGSIAIGPESWQLRVLGKGNKIRFVPLPSPTRDALLAYLASVGLPFEAVVHAVHADKNSAEYQAPILRGQRGRRALNRPAPSEPLHYQRLYTLLKKHMNTTADEVAAEDPIAAAKLSQASTHWLRHTCATLGLRNGVELPAIQRLLGHANLNVTSTYVTAQDEALQLAVEGFANSAA